MESWFAAAPNKPADKTHSSGFGSWRRRIELTICVQRRSHPSGLVIIISISIKGSSSCEWPFSRLISSWLSLCDALVFYPHRRCLSTSKKPSKRLTHSNWIGQANWNSRLELFRLEIENIFFYPPCPCRRMSPRHSSPTRRWDEMRWHQMTWDKAAASLGGSSQWNRNQTTRDSHSSPKLDDGVN